MHTLQQGRPRAEQGELSLVGHPQRSTQLRCQVPHPSWPPHILAADLQTRVSNSFLKSICLLPCICLGYHVFVWATMHVFGLPCICLGYHVFVWATIYLFELPCICFGYHVFVWATMYLFAFSCICLAFHVFVWASMCFLGFQHLFEPPQLHKKITNNI